MLFEKGSIATICAGVISQYGFALTEEEGSIKLSVIFSFFSRET